MVITALVQQATLAAAVIAGELPTEIENLLQNAGVFLFPQSPKEFVTECSCPDNPLPCKHIAAIFCILAQEFQKDPFVMFMLRGKSRDVLLANLMEKRTQLQQESTKLLNPPLAIESLSPNEQADIISNYWQTDTRLDDIHWKEEIPPATCHPLQALGPLPGWPPGQNFAKMIYPFYEHVSRKLKS